MAYNDLLNIEQQTLRQENSQWFTVLPSELLSNATRTSAMFKNMGCNGIIVEVITANKAGSPSFALSLQSVDNAGNSVTLATMAAITADGTNVYFFHPHADPTATSNNAFADEGTTPVTRDWKLVLTYTGTPANDKIDTEIHACYVK